MTIGYDSLLEDAEQDARVGMWLDGNPAPTRASLAKGARTRALEALRSERQRRAAEAEHAYVTHDLRVPFLDTARQWNTDRTKDMRREEARRRRADPAKRAKQNAYNAAYRQRQKEAA